MIPESLDELILRALERCRERGDFAGLLATARSFRYWALRLELPKPGRVDDELAQFAEHDIRALRSVLRQGWDVLREPLGDWRRKGAVLLARMEGQPLLADFARQGAAVLGSAGQGGEPRQMASLWGPEAESYRELPGHRAAVTACRLLEDGKLLATCDISEILVWDLASGIPHAIYGDGDHAETFDACAPRSGDWLATVQVRGGRIGRTLGNEASLKVWDLRVAGPPRRLTVAKDGPYACELSPDEQWLVVHYPNHVVRFWDTSTWELAGVIEGRSTPALRQLQAASCYAPDGSWFALANSDGSIGLWDPRSRTLSHLLPGHAAQATELVTPRDGAWLAGSDGRELRVWDTRRGTLIRRTSARGTGCAGLVADPAGQWTAACFGADSPRVIPVLADPGRWRHDGALAHATRLADAARVMITHRGAGSWTFTGARCRTGQDGREILSISAVEARDDNMVRSRYIVSSWDAATGSRTAGPVSRPGDLPAAAMPRHQDWAMLATSDRVEIIDPDTASVLQESSFPSDRLQSVAVSSHVAVAGFQSGMVRIFSASTPRRHAAGKAVGSAPAGLGGCFAVPHGRWILAWSHRTVVVVDWVTGSVRCILEGNDTGVFLNKVISACCFAPDGSWVATADDNGTIRVWDPDTGRQVAQARGQNGEDFVPGRCAGTRWMATVALDGRVWIRDRLGAKARDLGLVTGLRQACAGGDAWLAIEHDAGISLWDPLNGEHLRELPGERGGFPVRSGPAARFRLAAISTSGVIRITEPLSGQMQSLASRPGGQKAWRAGARVSCADPDGSWLATTDDDGGLDVWYVTSGAREKLSGGYEDPVTGCAVTSDGAMLASARRSGALHVWDTARWRRVAVARVRANLGECCWSPAGTSLCAAGDAGAYRFDLLDMRASDVG